MPGIYVGTSPIKNIYVGTTPVKSVFVGTTKVRPTGWTPGANTLIYYPLTSNLVDQMGNGYTGNMHGTCTFDSSTGIHVTGQSGNFVSGLSNGVGGKSTFTVNVWCKYESYYSVGYIAGYGARNTSGQSWNIALYGGYIQGMTARSAQNRTNLVAEDHNRHNIVCVGNSGVYTWYCDGVSKGTQNTGTLNNVTQLQLGWGGEYGSGRTCNGYIKDYIVETVARTAQEVSNYYNLTKGDYGL